MILNYVMKDVTELIYNIYASNLLINVFLGQCNNRSEKIGSNNWHDFHDNI